MMVTIVCTLATNWTGVYNDGRELGYVQTNRSAHAERMQHLDAPMFTVELPPVVSNIAVWRTNQPPVATIFVATNLVITNKYWDIRSVFPLYESK